MTLRAPQSSGYNVTSRRLCRLPRLTLLCPSQCLCLCTSSQAKDRCTGGCQAALGVGVPPDPLPPAPASVHLAMWSGAGVLNHDGLLSRRLLDLGGLASQGQSSCPWCAFKKQPKGHPAPSLPCGKWVPPAVSCVLILSCRKWGPSSCVLCPTALPPRKWVHSLPCPLRTLMAPTQEMCTPAPQAPAPAVKQPPTPAPGLWALLGAHTSHRRAPHTPLAAPPHPHSTACRHHRGLPLPQAHIGPACSLSTSLGGNDKEEIAQKSMINVDITCCVPLTVTR